eukprot:4194098-Pyramimonas_sp.AAC.1
MVKRLIIKTGLRSLRGPRVVKRLIIKTGLRSLRGPRVVFVFGAFFGRPQKKWRGKPNSPVANGLNKGFTTGAFMSGLRAIVFRGGLEGIYRSSLDARKPQTLRLIRDSS